MKNSKLGVLLVVLFFCTSCNEEDFLEDFDTKELFAAPTQIEIDAVIADWESRDLSPKGYTLIEETPIGTAGAVLKMIAYEVDGFKQYGALVIPGRTTPVPVRMWLKGFSFNPEEIQTNFSLSGGDDFDIPYIFAVPALRGQPINITLNGVAYASPIAEGNKCDAFDEATDDAIALLNIIESTEVNADMERVSVRGGSRGGTVAMLMGERDERVKRVIGIAGPTNMLQLTSKNENDPTYKCQFLDALVNKGTTVQQARHKMIASSPVYFSKYLPQTQLHLAENDRIVPVSQGEQLERVMKDAGLDDTFELFIYKGRDHSNIGNNNMELINRLNQFLTGF